MPEKGSDSVNLLSGSYDKVKELVETMVYLAYRSVTGFVAEAVRRE